MAALNGCGGRDPQPGAAAPQPAWYAADFAAEPGGGWLTYRGTGTSCEPLVVMTDDSGQRSARSQGPWWLDANHAPLGLGYLHLLAFAYHLDWSEDGRIPGLGPGKPLDLRNATVVIRWRPTELQLPPEARLNLWFQTQLPAVTPLDSKLVNYLFTGQTLQVAGTTEGWRETRLQLTADDRQYACLGSNQFRTNTYSCEWSPTQALREWNVNLGIVAFFPDASAAQKITGAFDIQSIEIHPDPSLVHGLTPPLPPSPGARRKSTCR